MTPAGNGEAQQVYRLTLYSCWNKNQATKVDETFNRKVKEEKEGRKAFLRVGINYQSTEADGKVKTLCISLKRVN